MNAKSLLASLLLIAAILIAGLFLYAQKTAAAGAAQNQALTAQVSHFQERAAALEQKLALAEKERDRFKTEAAEVHKLRGELSTLRKAHDALARQLAQQPRTPPQQPGTSANPSPIAAATTAEEVAAALRGHYPELAQNISTLRKKISSGTPLDADERAWLEQMKVQLDKLEGAPQDFAAFQAAMIQNIAGVSDPQKLQQIQQTIQKVYENAAARGLTLDARPPGDPSWVEQRHQLDRRGTTAIQRILDENERAAFDRSFLGVMGADLGTGVDKSLYPPGFLREAPQPTP